MGSTDVKGKTVHKCKWSHFAVITTTGDLNKCVSLQQEQFSVWSDVSEEAQLRQKGAGEEARGVSAGAQRYTPPSDMSDSSYVPAH